MHQNALPCNSLAPQHRGKFFPQNPSPKKQAEIGTRLDSKSLSLPLPLPLPKTGLLLLRPFCEGWAGSGNSVVRIQIKTNSYRRSSHGLASLAPACDTAILVENCFSKRAQGAARVFESLVHRGLISPYRLGIGGDSPRCLIC
jgi:hypothetical protein